jgi:DNA replication protein DnaC
MNDVNVKDKMQKLKLSGMMDLYDHRLEQAIQEKWAYSTFLEMLLTDAIEKKDHKQLTLRLSKSRLDLSKTMESFDLMRQDLTIPVALIRELSTCTFIEKKQNIFIFGASGLGKSHLANALGHQACRRGYEVLFQCTKGMLDWVFAGQGDGTHKKRLAHIIKIPLLICDDWGLQELCEEQQQDLYQIIAERYEKKSLILTTNRAMDEWSDVFANQLIGSAAVDRLVHRGVGVLLEGPSQRLVEYKKTSQLEETNKHSSKNSLLKAGSKR